MIRKWDDDKAFARLPKWAQAEITRLTYDVEYHKDRLTQVKGKDTNTGWGTGYNNVEDEIHYLPNNEQIFFLLQGELLIHAHVAKYRGIEYLDVNGEGTLIVEPRASNSLRIFDGRRIR